MITGFVIVGIAVIGFLGGYYVGGRIADKIFSGGMQAKRVIVAATFGAASATAGGVGAAAVADNPEPEATPIATEAAVPAPEPVVRNTPPVTIRPTPTPEGPRIPEGYSVVLQTVASQRRSDGSDREATRCTRIERLVGWESDTVAITEVAMDCENEDFLGDQTSSYLVDLISREVRPEGESEPIEETLVDEQDGVLTYVREEVFPSGDFTYRCNTQLTKDARTLFRTSYQTSCQIFDSEGNLWGTYGMDQDAALDDSKCAWSEAILGTWQVEDTSKGRRTYTFTADGNWEYRQYKIQQPEAVFTEDAGTWICLPEDGTLDFQKGGLVFNVLSIDANRLEWDIPNSSPLNRVE